MVTFIRELIAAPVRVGVWANGFLHLFDPLKAVQIIWVLTGEPADGAAVVMLTARSTGIEAARQKAESIFEKCPDESIAAAAAWAEASLARDLRGAMSWIGRSRAAGCEDGASLLQLELSLSEFLPDYDYPTLVDRILARNDLPGAITRDALLRKARLLLAERQWDDARVIADRILAIEEHSLARWVYWVTALAAGDEAAAQTEYARIRESMAPEILWGFEALGRLYLGDFTEAEAVLGRRTDEGQGPAVVDRQVAEFIQTRDISIGNMH